MCGRAIRTSAREASTSRVRADSEQLSKLFSSLVLIDAKQCPRSSWALFKQSSNSRRTVPSPATALGKQGSGPRPWI
eukprot:1739529-Alexandrium_andersonii.AAC.1